MQRLRNKIYTLLRQSEGFFKTDMIYLAKGGTWLLSGYIIQGLLGLVLLTAFANLVPKESYGTYQFIISISAILTTFTLTGMATAISKAVAQGSMGSLRYGFSEQIKWSVTIVFSSVIMATYYYLKNDISISVSLLIVGATQPFISAFGLYNNFLTGKQAFRESSLLNILNKFLPFLIIFPVLFLTDSAVWIIFAYFGSHLISSFISYIFVLKKYNLIYIKDNNLLNYSKHLSFITSISKLSEHLDKVLVWYFLGAEKVAVYSLAQLPIYHLQVFFQIFHQLTFAKIAQKSFEVLKVILPSKLLNYFGLTGIITLFYIIFAPIIFKTFFPNYLDSVIFTQILALTLLTVPRNIILQAFTAHEMKNELYKINTSSPIIRIILLLILLPNFGIWGAIGANLITEVYNTILQYYLFKTSIPKLTVNN